MEELFSLKVLLRFALVAFLILVLLVAKDVLQKRTRIVFCDVNNGDGIYMRLYPQIDILMDAGNGRDMLDCLGKYMPLYDSTIEYVFITHPHKDHYGGYQYILDRYNILTLVAPDIKTSSQEYSFTLKRSREKIGPPIQLVQGDSMQIGNSRLEILWPTMKFLNSAKDIEIDDLNEISLISVLSTHGYTILFTGDSPPQVLSQIEDISPQNVDVLKVPHHGSRIGLTEEYIDHIRPHHAVISVGENNRYQHPSDDIIDMLKRHKIPYCMTSEKGDIILTITSRNLKIPC